MVYVLALEYKYHSAVLSSWKLRPDLIVTGWGSSSASDSADVELSTSNKKLSYEYITGT